MFDAAEYEAADKTTETKSTNKSNEIKRRLWLERINDCDCFDVSAFLILMHEAKRIRETRAYVDNKATNRHNC